MPAPTIVQQNLVTLTHGMTTVSLPSPQFNNVESVALTRISRETRDRTLKVFSDSIWPTLHSFEWEFIGLTQAQRDDLIAFIQSTLGLPITVVDYESRSWNALITVIDIPFTQTGRGCEYTAQLHVEVIP